jgi:hypothetical protein
MSQHSCFLFDEFLYTLHAPVNYNQENSTPILIDLFEFLVKNSTTDYKTNFEEILMELKEF